MYIHKHTDWQKYLPTLTERVGGQRAKGRERERNEGENVRVYGVYSMHVCDVYIYYKSRTSVLGKCIQTKGKEPK